MYLLLKNNNRYMNSVQGKVKATLLHGQIYFSANRLSQNWGV